MTSFELPPSTDLLLPLKFRRSIEGLGTYVVCNGVFAIAIGAIQIDVLRYLPQNKTQKLNLQRNDVNKQPQYEWRIIDPHIYYDIRKIQKHCLRWPILGL